MIVEKISKRHGPVFRQPFLLQNVHSSPSGIPHWYKFPCFDPNCKNEFPLIGLQNVLAPDVFSNLIHKMQEKEISHVEIPNLVSCPYCTFCKIADMNITTFRCLNLKCLKVTCRHCKEPNHLPLRCEEIKQKPQLQFRTFKQLTCVQFACERVHNTRWFVSRWCLPPGRWCLPPGGWMVPPDWPAVPVVRQLVRPAEITARPRKFKNPARQARRGPGHKENNFLIMCIPPSVLFECLMIQ
uniref:IBR domain-containing protein n=1 Tax=Strigamia maritima TaxID=126957 RepID=T1JGU5_STRMM